MSDQTKFELTGKIKVIFDTQTFASGFSKRKFVITTKAEYPQDIKLEMVKDKTIQLDNFTPGNNVQVSFDIRGNEHKERHFVNLVAWRIVSLGVDKGESAPEQAGTGGYMPDENMPF